MPVVYYFESGYGNPLWLFGGRGRAILAPKPGKIRASSATLCLSVLCKHCMLLLGFFKVRRRTWKRRKCSLVTHRTWCSQSARPCSLPRLPPSRSALTPATLCVGSANAPGTRRPMWPIAWPLPVYQCGAHNAAAHGCALSLQLVHPFPIGSV